MSQNTTQNESKDPSTSKQQKFLSIHIRAQPPHFPDYVDIRRPIRSKIQFASATLRAVPTPLRRVHLYHSSFVSSPVKFPEDRPQYIPDRGPKHNTVWISGPCPFSRGSFGQFSRLGRADSACFSLGGLFLEHIGMTPRNERAAVPVTGDFRDDSARLDVYGAYGAALCFRYVYLFITQDCVWLEMDLKILMGYLDKSFYVVVWDIWSIGKKLFRKQRRSCVGGLKLQNIISWIYSRGVNRRRNSVHLRNSRKSLDCWFKKIYIKKTNN